MRVLPVTFVTSLVLACSVLVAADKKNMLKPTNKVDSWRFEQHEQGKGTIKPDGDAILVEVTETGAEGWHVQAVQTGLDLNDGKDYVLKFKVKADGERTIPLNAMIDIDDWHMIGLTDQFETTKDWKDHEFTFRADGVAKENKNRISFILGADKGKIWFKDMTLTEK